MVFASERRRSAIVATTTRHLFVLGNANSTERQSAPCETWRTSRTSPTVCRDCQQSDARWRAYSQMSKFHSIVTLRTSIFIISRNQVRTRILPRFASECKARRAVAAVASRGRRPRRLSVGALIARCFPVLGTVLAVRQLPRYFRYPPVIGNPCVPKHKIRAIFFKLSRSRKSCKYVASLFYFLENGF